MYKQSHCIVFTCNSVLYVAQYSEGKRPLYKGRFSKSQIIGFPILLNLREEYNLSTQDTY